MAQININFVDFTEIMEQEIIFHRHRFYGNSDTEKERAKKWWLDKYYQSLNHVKSSQLKLGFKKCLERHDKFPTVAQLVKFCPIKQVQAVVDPDYTKPVPIPPAVQKKLDHMKSGPSITKISREMMDSMKAMCRGRFGGDWKKTFQRWDDENEARIN